MEVPFGPAASLMKKYLERIVLVNLCLLAWSCAADAPAEPVEPPVHEVAEDLIPVADPDTKGDDILPNFDRNNIVADAFFNEWDALDADQMQAFLEDSPYGTRSWMADYLVNGVSASKLLVDAAEHHRINPILLLVRLQVEQGLVSRTTRPSQSRIDRALGCGCHDGSDCFSRFLGFENQLECSAETHRRLFDFSVNDESTDWVKGEPETSLEGLRIVPVNHATAALYAYTPWVLRGRGGNWLVWNVARKYVRHLVTEGLYTRKIAPFVGTGCENDDDCQFDVDGEFGFCLTFESLSEGRSGFCTLTCEGYCPDKAGRAGTFCIESPAEGLGVCASKSGEENDDCTTVPGTLVAERDRFIGNSGAPVSSANVCAPDTL